MNKKGRRDKRANDAMKKICLTSRYTRGRVICTRKKHPNYFLCEIYDSWTDKWELHYTAYISAYMNADGSFIKVR